MKDKVTDPFESIPSTSAQLDLQDYTKALRMSKCTHDDEAHLVCKPLTSIAFWRKVTNTGVAVDFIGAVEVTSTCSLWIH
jgi:hypothetical protein